MLTAARMVSGTLFHTLTSDAASRAALADRRLRTATLLPSCSRHQHSTAGCQTRLGTRSSALCASRQPEAQTQKPGSGETLDFQPEELQSAEDFDWSADITQQQQPPDVEELGLTRLDKEEFPDPLELDVDQEYTNIEMDGCTFVLPSDGDKLRLDSVRVVEDGSRQLSSPSFSGDVPREPALYQQVPWVREKHGDCIRDRENEFEVLKVFLIRRDEETLMLDFDTVVCLDAHERSVVREAVEGARDSAPEDCMLRIREGQLTLERIDEIPSVDEVVENARVQRLIETKRKQDAEMEEEAVSLMGAGTMDDDTLGDDDDDFDEPDVPAVDYA